MSDYSSFQLTQEMVQHFEQLKRISPEGIEYWSARDLQEPLGYAQWRRFIDAVERAKISCQSAGHDIQQHFADARKMVDIGSNSQRQIDDVLLTRGACYLVALNGDPRKIEIAIAQSYFVQQTYNMETLFNYMAELERLYGREELTLSQKALFSTLYARGINAKMYSVILSEGDRILFGGKDTRAMKGVWNISDHRALADFAPDVVIGAKHLINLVTKHQVQSMDLRDRESISNIYKDTNQWMRDSLLSRGIVPEELPPEEDIKKIERRHKANQRRLNQQSGIFPSNFLENKNSDDPDTPFDI